MTQKPKGLTQKIVTVRKVYREHKETVGQMGEN